MLKTIILIVEDSKFLRVASGRVLAKAGYNILNAADGEEALRSAYENLPDLILLDMLLPKLGGQQVLHALKSNPETAHIPVIVLSSLSQVNEAKLKEEGAAAYFEKSRLDLDLKWQALVIAVETVLNRARNAQPAHG